MRVEKTRGFAILRGQGKQERSSKENEVGEKPRGRGVMEARVKAVSQKRRVSAILRPCEMRMVHRP